MMPTTCSLRGTAILAAAFTLAACGSDKAAGPSTANNQQIISEMTQTLGQADDSTTSEEYIALQAAIAGLSAGAPVNPGNVTIDGRSYSFSTTSLTVEERDSVSGDVLYRLSLVVGWRHTNGDSLFLAMYAPQGETPDLDRRSPAAFMKRSGTATPSLAKVSALLRSGSYTVSRSVSAGPDQQMVLAAKLGGNVWGALWEDGIESGSISYSSAAGECDLAAVNDSDLEIGASSCEMQRANVALQANTFDAYSESDTPADGPSIAIPAQGVVGVKLVVSGSIPS